MHLRLIPGLLLLGGCARPALEQPSAARPLSVPEDHRSHPELKSEWWYWNGHLSDAQGAKVDFFLGFVRHDPRGDRCLGLPVLPFPPESWMAMFALTDRGKGRYEARAKTAWPDFWAAGASDSRLFHDDWHAQWEDGAWKVRATRGGEALQLTLRPRKAAELYGQGGFVDVPGIPHYVYTYTDLEAEGTLGGRAVKGIAWFDHFIGEVMTGRFKAWDWMSLQLDDGYAYMIAQLRADDGSTLPYWSFEVAPDGSVRSLPRGEPTWTLLRLWKSPHSGRRYRLGWRIRAADLDLSVQPVIDDQEFRRAPVSRFYEGASRITGTHRGRAVEGDGYLETVAEGGLPVEGIRGGW